MVGQAHTQALGSGFLSPTRAGGPDCAMGAVVRIGEGRGVTVRWDEIEAVLGAEEGRGVWSPARRRAG